MLYFDGHVRVYHGHARQLPKHDIARERPFFVLNQPVDPGMIQTAGF